MTRIAEQAERFEDMMKYLAAVLDEKGVDVSADERNLLSLVFKNLILSKRAACRTIASIEQNLKYSKFRYAPADYKQNIEDQLTADCERVVELGKLKLGVLDGLLQFLDKPQRQIVELPDDDHVIVQADTTKKQIRSY